jgi:activator of HSP90 ATPase
VDCEGAGRRQELQQLVPPHPKACTQACTQRAGHLFTQGAPARVHRHWSETNLSEWSKEKLTELLVGIVAIEEGSGQGWCKTTKLEKCTGDVTVQSRKQKKFPLYELEIKLTWEGQLWDENVRVHGRSTHPAQAVPAAQTAPAAPRHRAGRATPPRRSVSARRRRSAASLRVARRAHLVARAEVARRRCVGVRQGKVCAEAKGHIKIPDLSEETYDDLEMTIVCDEETKAKLPLKEAMRKAGAKKIREACVAFVKQLKESVYSGADAALVNKKKPTDRVNSSYVVSSKESGKTGDVQLKYSFVPPPHIIYSTFLDTNRIRGATASDASMSSEVGGKFSMFSGAVEGENVTLTPFDEKEGKATIVWKWRFSTWQPGHFSTVTLDFNKKDDGTTELHLAQSGVPEEERERTEQGWKGLLCAPRVHSRTASVCPPPLARARRCSSTRDATARWQARPSQGDARRIGDGLSRARACASLVGVSCARPEVALGTIP